MLKNSQKLLIRLQKCYRTHRSSGRVDNAVMWQPYPYLLQVTFEELTYWVGFELCYRTHRSSGRVKEVLPNPQKFGYQHKTGKYPRDGSVGRT